MILYLFVLCLDSPWTYGQLFFWCLNFYFFGIVVYVSFLNICVDLGFVDINVHVVVLFYFNVWSVYMNLGYLLYILVTMFWSLEDYNRESEEKLKLSIWGNYGMILDMRIIEYGESLWCDLLSMISLWETHRLTSYSEQICLYNCWFNWKICLMYNLI